ncbi:exodeoxyribonuclease V subunit gamma [Arachidicoccus ginsenosidivorans]|uniref:RecBCD enzyme subunit RecC n=1 Tax=Arachidicoccus ginsenosidivorans TaxID=496057 RepID=A0A5B8VJ62_9BACT|nr:exodeoxyribonuclease V subunit gamma [Arachidicoccus ginsenosidivorans]QEC70626.1 exodeoxyribonuclease V subunit gamma [Arachidicoccus ginsenosidivorans]
MAFQLKASNSLEELAKSLYFDLHEYNGNVFRPYYIVTQTDGMNNWLGTKLAEWQGIAAGIAYLKPNDLIFKIYLLLGGTAQTIMSGDNLCWLLFHLMGTPEFMAKFPKVASYYVLTEEKSQDQIAIDNARIKRLGLAKKVADLFDQYQIYRTDMIMAWNKGQQGGQELEAWQFYLWEKINIKDQDNTGRGKRVFADKNEIADFIEKAIQQNQTEVARLLEKMPAVFIFGISLLTEYHLHIFDLLAGKMQIYFYLLNPAPADYWYDDLSEKRLIFLRKLGKVASDQTAQGHPLLQSMGKVIKDTFGMLFKKDEILNSYEALPEILPEEDSLLHKLQLSIYENRTPDKETPLFAIEDIKDGSLSIHACYSPLREVESLYNFLVYLIDRKKQSLSARDIVVMVSDIDHYAAYIRAVFDHAPYRFPYKIADERFTESDSISSALESLLLLESSAFTAETVLRLLDSSYIRSHLGITRLELLREVLEQAGIRFGIEGNYTDDSVYVSWNYGLKRIMYGICMMSDQQVGEGPEGFYPLNLVEGSDSEQVIQFVAFVQDLMDMLERREQDRTLSGWADFVKQLLEKFILKEEQQGDEEFEYLAALLADYNSSEAFFGEAISFGVFMESFGQRLITASRNSNFASGGVTFCSLIPMRSIPFKVVALLGLDYDKFPRKEQSLGFNLMEIQKRPGDRNVKANDKHLFLETILSARDYLYISYIGRNIKDNTDLPASSLVEELIEYIVAECRVEKPAEKKEIRKAIIFKHALHHFSPMQSGDVPQYLHLVSDTENEIQDKAATADLESDTTDLNLDRFIGFLINPIKGYLNQVLGIYYGQRTDVLKEEEIFELNNLQLYQYKGELIDLNEEEAWEDYRDKGVKTGKLPLKNSSRVAMIELLETVSPVRVLFETQIAGAAVREVHVNYSCDGISISGKLRLYGDKLILLSWSKKEMKTLLQGYIQYLMLLVSDIHAELVIISSKQNQVFLAQPLNKQRAIESLNQLIELYQRGQNGILPFVLGLALKGTKDGLDFKKWYSKIQNKNNKGAYTDPYIQKADELGVFSPEALENYIDILEMLESPLKELFPTFNMGS